MHWHSEAEQIWIRTWATLTHSIYSHSLYPVHYCILQYPGIVLYYVWYPQSFPVPVPIPVSVPVPVPVPGRPRPCCPHRLTPTFAFSGRAGSFSTGPVAPSFSTPISPPFHPTPAHFFLTSTTNLSALLFFFFIAPYPSPNLASVTTGFSSSSPPNPIVGTSRACVVVLVAFVVCFRLALNGAPSGPPPPDQPVSCISGSSNLTCPTVVSGFGPPVPR